MEAYVCQDGNFIKIDQDETGRITKVIQKDVPAETAAREILENYLQNSLQGYRKVKPGETAVNVPSSEFEEEIASCVIAGAYMQIYARSGLTDDEKIVLWRKAFGDDPNIIRLAAKELGEDIVKYIWGNEKVDEALQNDLPPEQPRKTDKNIIINSRKSQGVGLLHPTKGGLAEQRNQIKYQGTASSTSYGGKTGGDPIVLFCGQFYHQVTDLEVAGRGLSFSFTRTYLNQTIFKGPLGYNWDHNYNLWLRETQEMLPDGTLQNVVYRSNGQLREDRYVQTVEYSSGSLPALDSFVDAVFQGPPGFFDRLEKSGGTYILHTVGGLRYEYHDSFIRSISDVNGNQISFQYSDQLLTKIIDPVGKEFIFEYDSLNRIAALHDMTGNRKIQYVYNSNGDLEEVDLLLEPDLIAGTDYWYSGTDQPVELQHNLIEIINADGKSILENEYGSEPGSWEYCRVIRQRSANGEYLYEYGPVFEPDIDPGLDSINFPFSFTRVVYPNSHSIENWFNSQGNVVLRKEELINEAGIRETLSSTYRYNEDGLLLLENHPDGSTVEYLYRREEYANLNIGNPLAASPEERLAFGNLLRMVERPRNSVGEKRVIITEYAYGQVGNHLASQRGPYYATQMLNPVPGEVISEVYFDYDTKGNVVKVKYPQVERADGTLQSIAETRFVYNQYGLITDITTGTLHTHFSYFSDILRSGFIQEKVEDADGVKRRTLYDVDLLGRTLKITTPYGAVTDLEWTSFDTLKKAILPSVVEGSERAQITYQYSRGRNVESIIEELKMHDGTEHPDKKIIKKFRYDPYSRMTHEIICPASQSDARTHRLHYTPYGMAERDVDCNGNVTFIKYNERMLPIKVLKGWSTPEQQVTQIRYDYSGAVVNFKTGTKLLTTFKHDDFGRYKSTTDADGNEMEIEYDAAGRGVRYCLYGLHPETGIKVRWTEEDHIYDNIGRLKEKVEHLFIPGGTGTDTLLRTRYYYDANNRLERVVSPGGAEWKYEYDGLSRIKLQIDPDGNETEWEYNDTNRTTSIIDKETGIDENGNKVVQFFKHVIHYNNRELPVEEVDSLGNKMLYHYDSRNLLTHIVDAAGQEYFVDIDAFGQETAHRTYVSGREVRTELFYDLGFRLVKLISPEGGSTKWTYDSLNRISSIERDGNLVTTFKYDENGNLYEEKNENEIIIRRFYSDGGILRIQETDQNGFIPPPGFPAYTPEPSSTIKFKSTPIGSVAFTQNDEAAIILRYDSLERLVEEVSNGRSISYKYDFDSNRSGLLFPDGRNLTYQYSPAGALTQIIQNSAGANYPGDPSEPDLRTMLSIQRVGKRPISIKFGNSFHIEFGYDAGRRVVAINRTRLKDRVVINNERSLFGPHGELKAYQNNHFTRFLEYDEISRLTKAVDYQGIALADIALLQPPDTKGGFGSALQSNEDSVIDSLKLLAGTSPIVNSFEYILDSNTNRKQVEVKLGTSGQVQKTIYIVDTKDQYQSVGGVKLLYDRTGNLLDDGRNKYRYDSLNNLSQINSTAGTIRIRRDPFNRPIHMGKIGEWSRDNTFDGLLLIGWQGNGLPSGHAIPMERPNQYAHLASGNQDYFPLMNMMDSVVGWVSNDDVKADIWYDPFGQVLERSSNWPAPFAYSGYLFDEAVEVYHLIERSYNPRLGCFLQRDPKGFADGTNLYAYVHHAPGTFTDFWGTDSTQTSSWNKQSEEKEDQPLGLYLPFTKAGEEAANYWARLVVEGDKQGGVRGALKQATGWTFGLLASLWTPDTAVDTFITLGTAGLGAAANAGRLGLASKPISTLFELHGSLQTGISLTEAITGTGITGEELGVTERVIKGGLGAFGAFGLVRGYSRQRLLATKDYSRVKREKMKQHTYMAEDRLDYKLSKDNKPYEWSLLSDKFADQGSWPGIFKKAVYEAVHRSDLGPKLVNKVVISTGRELAGWTYSKALMNSDIPFVKAFHLSVRFGKGGWHAFPTLPGKP